jgi:CRISPR-associated protein Csm1
MQLFFSAYFDALASHNNIYVIYSGGDDAFVVGQWKEVIQFAQELHTAFTQFVCQNSNLHFSAGVFMGKPHYPVGRFFKDAGNLLDEAKNNSSKNQIDVFNHALSWDSFKSKIKFGTDIAELMEKGEGTDKQKLTVSFTYRLLQMVKSSFYERDTYSKDDGNLHRRASVNMALFARNSANLRYLFARNGYAQKDINDISQRVERELITGFLCDFNVRHKYDKIKNARDYLVALNYALFTIRSNKKTNTNN